jgi:hypothetical protein
MLAAGRSTTAQMKNAQAARLSKIPISLVGRSSAIGTEDYKKAVSDVTFSGRHQYLLPSDLYCL